MNKLGLLCLGLAVLAPAAPALASHPAGATVRDVQRLHDALENLDHSLEMLDPADPGTAEFKRRERAISTDVTRLSNQIERHRRNKRTGLGATADDVERLRRRIAELQRDVDLAYTRRYGSTEMTLPEGAQILVRLEDSVSSRTARVEDRVEASVETPVRDSSGRVVIPAGTRVSGTVTKVDRASRPARGGELDISFDTIYIDERVRTDLRTRMVSLDEGIDRRSAERAGIGAVLGAVLGGIVSGTKGALIGLVIGGGGGIASTRGEEVELPAGTVITLVLERPLAVRRY